MRSSNHTANGRIANANRQEDAAVRREEIKGLSKRKRIERLDARLGLMVGAVRERRRLKGKR